MHNALQWRKANNFQFPTFQLWDASMGHSGRLADRGGGIRGVKGTQGEEWWRCAMLSCHASHTQTQKQIRTQTDRNTNTQTQHKQTKIETHKQVKGTEWWQCHSTHTVLEYSTFNTNKETTKFIQSKLKYNTNIGNRSILSHVSKLLKSQLFNSQ